MNHWSWWLGRLFREANNIHRAYFNTRHVKVPDDLIGGRYVLMAYQQPQAALSMFLANFQKYMNWAETYKSKDGEYVYSDLLRYKEAIQKIGELANIPTRPNDTDKILLGVGFGHFPGKDAADTDSVPSDEVPSDEDTLQIE